MNYFTQKRLFIAAIIILALLNVATLVTIWSMGRNPREGRGLRSSIQKPGSGRITRSMLAEELRLTDDQKDFFREAGVRFNENSKRILMAYHRSKIRMFDELAKHNPDTALIRHLTDSLGDRQTELEKATAIYFLQLKHVCNPVQQQHFPRIFHRLLRHMALPEPEMPPLPPPPAKPNDD